MVVWDGSDLDIFLDILEQIEKNQVVKVCTEDGRVTVVSSFDDVRGLLPSKNVPINLSREEYEDVLKVFIPSKEMREYLLTKELRQNEVKDIILGAPVALETKLKYCRLLRRRDDIFYFMVDKTSSGLHEQDYDPRNKRNIMKWYAEHSFIAHERAIQSALDALKLCPGEILILREAWYDEDNLEDNVSRLSVPLLSLDAALRYVRDEMQEENWDDNTECWTMLEKWGPGKNGEMDHLYTYYLIRDEIVFFEKKIQDPKLGRHWYTEEYDYSFGGQNLNLPIPYQPGDIVTVNCLPFAPIKCVLLLEVGEDCCGVSALSRRGDGKWETGALKHAHCWGDYRPMLSPLYRIRLFDKQTPLKDEREFLPIQKYIAGDAEKGRSLWNAINQPDSGGIGDKDLLALIDDSHGENKIASQINSTDVLSILPPESVHGSGKYNTDVSPDK